MTTARDSLGEPTLRESEESLAAGSPWDDLKVIAIWGEQSKVVALRPGVLVVGRGSDSDLVIDSPGISRRHARLFVGDVIRVDDCGSQNGTFVRDRRLEEGEATEVRPGEIVELGRKVTLVLQGGRREPGCGATPQHAAGELEALLQRLSQSSISVVVLGETGVGKEVFARRLHALSARAAHPFVAVNCAALTPSLLESELFGHEKGAFTGATQSKHGLLEAAKGGSILLDEVGDMPVEVQAKLLRAIENREVVPVGGVQPRAIDARFIAATNRDLEAEVRAGRFRRDLWFRLNGITVRIPPLRQRRDEVEPLARTFVAEAAQQAGAAPPDLTPAALGLLLQHTWPGNVRELRNTIHRAILLCGGEAIRPEHLQLGADDTGETPHGETAAAGGAKLVAQTSDPERRRVLEALEACGGNQTHAAKLLGLSRNTLAARMEEYGVRRPRKR